MELLARLPAGWAEFFDDDGAAYYVHSEMDETCWEAPQLELEVEDIHTYIFMCVCVCVCACIAAARAGDGDP